jgi:hypothetical protein
LSNLAITGSFAFTPGGSSFLFGRLIEDGIAQRYLNERCPDPKLRVCDYARQMPTSADDWLWGNDTPFYRLGGAEGFGPEATSIVIDSIKRYPLMHAKAAAAAAIEQFTSFATDVSVDDNGPAVESVREHAPALLAPMMQAKQLAERFDVGPLNLVHVPVGALSIAGLIAALVWRRRLKLAPEIAALCLGVLLALVLNAAVCGVFSHPVDRYQSRLVVLAPFALAIAVAANTRRKATSP